MIPAPGIYHGGKRGPVIVIVLDLDEAENVAFALGLDDKGAQELLTWVDRARGEPEGCKCNLPNSLMNHRQGCPQYAEVL